MEKKKTKRVPSKRRTPGQVPDFDDDASPVNAAGPMGRELLRANSTASATGRASYVPESTAVNSREVATRLRRLTEKWSKMDVIPDEDLRLFDVDEAEIMMQPHGPEFTAILDKDGVDISENETSRRDYIRATRGDVANPNQRIIERMVKTYQQSQPSYTIDEELKTDMLINKAMNSARVTRGTEPIVAYGGSSVQSAYDAAAKGGADMNKCNHAAVKELSSERLEAKSVRGLPSSDISNITPLNSLMPPVINLDSPEWLLTLDQPPGRLLPPEQRSTLIQFSAAAQLLDRYMNKYKTYGRRPPFSFQNEKEFEIWREEELTKHVGQFMYTISSSASNERSRRVGFMYYLERPLFVCFVFVCHPDGKISWDGYAYVRGHDANAASN